MTKLTIFLGILMTGMCHSPLTAQTTEAETAPPQTTGSAVDLEITPRLGAGYNSSAAGYDGFGRFEGFVPLLQNPGKNLLFLEGRLLLDNGAHLGGNILLGYRAFNPELNRTFGGYVGYDNRDTGESNFNQIGLGLESLGEIWDLRLNGYLPVGDTRQVVTSNTVESNFQQTGDPFFQGNSLLIPGNSTFQTTTIQEAAMSGLDFEVGAKVAEFANGGEVRGYGGVYYYDASASPSTVGGKLRVEVRPTDYLNLGLGVQHDDLFGTNILFTIGGTFPGTRPAGYRQRPDELESVWARMGESVARTTSIVVDQQVESVSVNGASTMALTNPATGQPWVFVHVSEGGNSDGTFESPFATIKEGVAVAQSDGNYIVYVRSGTASGDTGPITIPALVQLLSAGVLQEIDTQELGLVALPFSANGQLTNFTGTITMENQSVLSGFNLTSNDGPGIAARNLDFVTIRDSSITSSSEAALLLENTTGNIVLTNTNLTGDGVPALVGTNIHSINFTGSSLTSRNSTTNGITLNGVTGRLSLTNGEITDSQAEGILVENSTGAIAISNFQINRAQNRGILLRQVDGTVEIANNTITDTAGVLPNNPTRANPPTGQGIGLFEARGTINITNNEITGTTGFDGNIDTINPENSYLASGQGIAILNTTAGAVNLNIADNTITGNANQGLSLANLSGAIAITNNDIFDTTGTAGNIDNINPSNSELFTGQGIAFNNDRLEPVNLTIDGNNLRRNTSRGISLVNLLGTINITNNEIRDTREEMLLPGADIGFPTGQGIVFSNDLRRGEVVLNIANNRILRNINQGILLTEINGTIRIENNRITDTRGKLTVFNRNNLTTLDFSGFTAINDINDFNDQAALDTTVAVIQSQLPTGQGIIVGNAIDQLNLTINNNQILNNDSHGMALTNLRDQVTITGNTVTGTSGAIGDPNNGEFSTGEGIFVTHINRGLNLTIAEGNRVSDNFEDGIVMIIGEPTGGLPTTAPPRADITISGNTVQNNGVNTANSTSNEIRGDGIRIFLEGDALVNRLDINNNTITSNQDDGIQISQGELTTGITGNGGTSELRNATISGNTIEDQVQQGINFRAAGGTADLVIENNPSISQNGGEGIAIFAAGNNASTAQINANVRFNTLTDNPPSGLFGTVINGGNLCIDLNSNNSNTGYLLTDGGGTLQVVDLGNVNGNNMGLVVFDRFNTDNVAACP
ncbi:MAG: hypothetical protein F6K47_26545 [Symploca sp. SIO2E6]|nr:hypothetical protein [Symploca sp. SIO2E6]